MKVADLRIEITPEPTEDERAAIVAALEQTLPTVAPTPPASLRPREGEPSRWRFAGRWWSKPVPLQRDRPW
ncbi:MAG: hypothetical protein ACRD0A_04930 [Acidimicrobiales bacterium]